MSEKLFSSEELARISNPVDSSDLAGKLTELMTDRGFYEGEFKLHRPWGLELKIREDLAKVFVESFFEEEDLPAELVANPGGPRILAISNERELPWQEGVKKSAFLRVLSGRLQIQEGVDDENLNITDAEIGELIEISGGIRNRLVGVERWSLVAEIFVK